MHSPDCDINDPNIEGIRKPCNCGAATGAERAPESAAPLCAFPVATGSPLMKHTYTVQTHYLGDWRNIVRDTRDFCLGFMHARKDDAPRNAYRLMRSDGKVMEEIPVADEVAIGQIAGWPTPEQYESAAKRALEQAARIRDQAAKHEAMRPARLANDPGQPRPRAGA
jgi:hypothetical protein